MQPADFIEVHGQSTGLPIKVAISRSRRNLLHIFSHLDRLKNFHAA